MSPESIPGNWNPREPKPQRVRQRADLSDRSYEGIHRLADAVMHEGQSLNAADRDVKEAVAFELQRRARANRADEFLARLERGEYAVTVKMGGQVVELADPELIRQFLRR